MTHMLALSVINDGSHYTARVENRKRMTKRDYRAYLLGLVNAKAKEERIKFSVFYKPRDIDNALSDLIVHQDHHADDEARFIAEQAELLQAGVAIVAAMPVEQQAAFMDSMQGKRDAAEREYWKVYDGPAGQ